MKKLLVLLIVVVSVSAMAQSRPVAITWTASTSSSVSGYNVYGCTVTTGNSCTPNITGTPLNSSLVSGTSFVIQEPISTAYGFSVVAVSPACTPTTPITTPCGTSSPLTANYVPVPPNPNPGTNVVVVVP